jgi:hypothetical protein
VELDRNVENKEIRIKSLNFLDDVKKFLTIPEAYHLLPPAPAAITHIRITLNRPLTWSERESLRNGILFEHDSTGELATIDITFHSNQAFSAYSDVIASRTLYEAFAEWIGEEYVNLYPRAVRTFSEAG